MAKESPIESVIPRLYKRNALNLLMYGFVKGARETLHTITIEAAIRMFMETMELSDDDFNFESARVNYHRMDKDLFNLKSQ